MKTQLHTHLKQAQQLNLSPQMQQSLKILQLSTIEIRELIDQSLLDNPFLEQESGHVSLSYEENHDGNDNPYTSYWKEQQSRSDDSDMVYDTNAQPRDLKKELCEQFFIATPLPHLREVGTHLIDLINEDGYLVLSEDDHLSQKFDRQTMEQAINIIHTLAPVGIGARSLAECLMLQLKDQDLYDPIYEAILNNIYLLTEKSPAALAMRCGISLDTLRERLNVIKSLNPKPGSEFTAQDPINYVTPDLLFIKYEGRWMAELNKEAYPRLTIDEKSFFNIAEKCKAMDEKIYINKQISSAQWLVKSLEQRAITMLKVAHAIIRHQEKFLTRGHHHLVPLKLKDIAREIDAHESTVSRAVTGKYAATPFGVIELKSFFSTALNDSQPTVSNKTIQTQIKKLIDMEPKSAPLSDDQLVTTLKSMGINIARRTVTKYREALQIPSSYERKKMARAINF
ncbi:RNA polymerase factor sigma-54 [Candidatus Odyssella thessalonicensis]|uniref:RNA polymerase factor sigma-54 n=1 Tax=Candidatus Odyssella thessalonicensis TaxID=84647 RepID=UPI000225C157|nr:RNA polymerase factor sigma-54 [Candidatus Odyssella thessalonicensis]